MRGIMPFAFGAAPLPTPPIRLLYLLPFILLPVVNGFVQRVECHRGFMGRFNVIRARGDVTSATLEALQGWSRVMIGRLESLLLYTRMR